MNMKKKDSYVSHGNILALILFILSIFVMGMIRGECRNMKYINILNNTIHFANKNTTLDNMLQQD